MSKKCLICLILIWILTILFFGCNRPPKAPTISGPATGNVNSPIDFTFRTTDPNNDDVAYQISWGDGLMETWTLYFPSGQDIPKTHIYSKSGNYSVMAKAKDIKEKESKWSNPHQILITSQTPNKPTIPDGPATGYVDTSYTFSSSATDPDGDSVAIRFDWDNGFISNWSNYVASGKTVSRDYSYLNSGTFYIIAQAKDIWGDTSVWSSPHTIIISSYTNQAPETPDKASGPVIVGRNAMNTYTTKTHDPNNDYIRYIFNWGDNSKFDTTDYFYSDSTASASHAWSDTGRYAVRVRAQDEKNALSNWSEELEVTVKMNRAPRKPSIFGPPIGRPGIQYTFKSVVFDDDGDSVRAKFYWGNGRTPKWTSYYASGDTIKDTITYSVVGSYSIRVVGQDALGDTSPSSDPRTFEITGDAWAYLPGVTGEEFISSPALLTSGNSVISLIIGCTDGFVYCLDSLGNLKWTYPDIASATGDAFNSSPAIGPDGSIYIGDKDGKVHGINANGTTKWAPFTVVGGPSFNSSPAINAAGDLIYIGCENETLYAIRTSDGAQEWVFDAHGPISSSPAIASDGAIVFGDENDSGRVYILNPDGTQRHVFLAAGAIYSSPTINGNKIYFGAGDTMFYAIDTNGTLLHTFIPDVRDEIHSSATIGPNGEVYFGDDNNQLFARNSDLTPLAGWRQTFASDIIRSSAAIGSNGWIFILDDNDYLLAYNNTGRDTVWSKRLRRTKSSKQEDLKSSPVIGPNGWIYVGSSEGIYAFKIPNLTGLANTPWPMFRHDIKHTGRVGGGR